jgi:hypothetical protein
MLVTFTKPLTPLERNFLVNKTIKSAIALLAISALPLISVAPASAVIDRDAFTFDCNVGTIGETDHALAAGETVTITLLNCDDSGFEISDTWATGNARLGSVIITATPIAIVTDPATIVVDEFSQLFLNDPGIIDEYFYVNLADDSEDPAGDLLATTSTTLTSTSDFFTTPEDAEIFDGDALIGGIAYCDVEVGSRPYSTVDVTITEPGTYAFRVVDTDPVEEDLYFGIEESPVGDSFLAIYTTFDPEDIDSGVVGCNDDGDDEGAAAAEMWEIAHTAADSRGQGDENLLTSTGFILDDQFPWFAATLQPGQYTLVGTLYSAYTESEWLETLDSAGVTEASMTYEMWGPEGGLVLGLADTGVDPAFGLWTGLALAGTGVAITVARRRAQRA